MSQQIFLTGPPRSGKTTLIKTLIEKCSLEYSGFFTEEILKEDKRVGFLYRTSEGKNGILAHIHYKSDHYVGKYGVLLKDFERDVLTLFESQKSLLIIDEIGKMEFFSNNFISSIEKVVQGDKSFLATISKQLLPSYSEWKKRNHNLKLFHLTLRNWSSIYEDIKYLIKCK